MQMHAESVAAGAKIRKESEAKILAMRDSLRTGRWCGPDSGGTCSESPNIQVLRDALERDHVSIDQVVGFHLSEAGDEVTVFYEETGNIRESPPAEARGASDREQGNR